MLPSPRGGGAKVGFGGEQGGALILGYFPDCPRYRDAPLPTGGEHMWVWGGQGHRWLENLTILFLGTLICKGFFPLAEARFSKNSPAAGL